jgi:NUMOD4 motif/HNH endonuclease
MYELKLVRLIPQLSGLTEYWVDISNYEGYYQVSNYGNVRSLDRVITEHPSVKNEQQTGKTQTLKGRILKPHTNSSGYYQINLNRKSIRTTFAIHQLVAQAFLDNRSRKPLVNHINGIKTDNNVNNLEWATYSENLEHAYKNRLRRAVKTNEVASKNYKRKLTEQQVREIKLLIAAKSLTLKQIANQYDVGRSTIGSIKSGRNWSYTNDCKTDNNLCNLAEDSSTPT